MVKGIGTDILKVARLEKLLGDPVDLSGSFVRKNFSEEEQRLCRMRKRPAFFLATNFAGKEAVLKALDVRDEGVLMKEIEILRDSFGRPIVQMSGTAQRLKEEREIHEILISLSFEEAYVIAFAICQ